MIPARLTIEGKKLSFADMSEGRILVGIDVGTSKVATVIAKVDEFINVLGVSEIKSAGIRKGQIVNIEEAVLCINSSLEAAERMAGYSVSHVAVSVGGSHIESQNSRGVVAVSNPEGEITKNDIARVIDAARAISLPSSREVIHVLPRNFTVDGQEGIKDPIGMSGIRLEVDTHLITASSISIRNLQKALLEVGVDGDYTVFSGYASSLSVLTDTEKELGVVLVDMGAGTSDISVYSDGSVSYSSVLPIGARHITNDLAIGLRISLESAEKIKLFLAKSVEKKRMIGVLGEEQEKGLEEYQQKQGDEIDVGALGITEELRKVSRKTLIEGIIRPRLNEIFTMVGLEVKKSGFGGQTPAGLVVTGGGARTIGVVDAAKRMLAMPVRIGIPRDLKGIIDEIEDTSYATAIGLIIYGARTESPVSLPFGISLPQIPSIRVGKVARKAVDFIKSFMP